MSTSGRKGTFYTGTQSLLLQRFIIRKYIIFVYFYQIFSINYFNHWGSSMYHNCEYMLFYLPLSYRLRSLVDVLFWIVSYVTRLNTTITFKVVSFFLSEAYNVIH